jgi:hypothetical protein
VKREKRKETEMEQTQKTYKITFAEKKFNIDELRRLSSHFNDNAYENRERDVSAQLALNMADKRMKTLIGKRKKLLKSIAEIERLINDSGFLHVDFHGVALPSRIVNEIRIKRERIYAERCARISRIISQISMASTREEVALLMEEARNV